MKAKKIIIKKANEESEDVNNNNNEESKVLPIAERVKAISKASFMSKGGQTVANVTTDLVELLTDQEYIKAELLPIKSGSLLMDEVCRKMYLATGKGLSKADLKTILTTITHTGRKDTSGHYNAFYQTFEHALMNNGSRLRFKVDGLLCVLDQNDLKALQTLQTASVQA